MAIPKIAKIISINFLPMDVSSVQFPRYYQVLSNSLFAKAPSNSLRTKKLCPTPYALKFHPIPSFSTTSKSNLRDSKKGVSLALGESSYPS